MTTTMRTKPQSPNYAGNLRRWLARPSLHPGSVVTGRDGPVDLRTRILLTRTEAAEALGMGLTFFDQHVAPHVRMVRRGRKRLVAVKELERWADQNSEALI